MWVLRTPMHWTCGLERRQFSKPARQSSSGDAGEAKVVVVRMLKRRGERRRGRACIVCLVGGLWMDGWVVGDIFEVAGTLFRYDGKDGRLNQDGGACRGDVI